MNKKKLLFLIFAIMCITSVSLFGMQNRFMGYTYQNPQGQGGDAASVGPAPDSYAGRTGVFMNNPSFIMMMSPQGKDSSIKNSIKDGFYRGLNEGTTTLVASLIVELTQQGIIHGVKLWQKPNKKNSEQSMQLQQLQQLMEAFEKDIEKKQKLLAENSTVINTAGKNVEQAQRIFNEQLEQKKQEFYDQIDNEQIEEYISFQSEQLKKQELIEFKKELAKQRQQKIDEFKQQHGISNDFSLSLEQSQKIDEFIKNLEKEANEKSQQYVLALEEKYSPEKQKKLLMQKALSALLEESPEANFAKLYDEYTNMALVTFQNQRKLMDGTLIEEISGMLNKKAAKAA